MLNKTGLVNRSFSNKPLKVIRLHRNKQFRLHHPEFNPLHQVVAIWGLWTAVHLLQDDNDQ